jgi:hypothetical protein
MPIGIHTSREWKIDDYVCFFFVYEKVIPMNYKNAFLGAMTGVYLEGHSIHITI